MSCCASNPREVAAARASAELQKKLQHWFKEDKKYIQILLLGTGESGKTTILKQMKILHVNGFSQEEQKEKCIEISKNLQESIFDIVDNMSKIEPIIEICDNEAKASADYILSVGKDITRERLSKEYYDNVRLLWKNKDIQKSYERSNEYQLIESAGYFLDKLDEIIQPNYIPSAQDILHCRVRTKGLTKLEFSMSVSKKYGGGTAKFWMYDVGGQRGERRRWISVFEGINAVLFLIACSDFDQSLREDKKKNRLQESLELFRDIFWSRFLRQSGIIVFLNKQDILKKKIEEGRKIDKLFPDYKNFTSSSKDATPNNEYDKVKLFIRKKIQDIVNNKPEPQMVHKAPGVAVLEEVEDKSVHVHFTTATDTNNIKLVFDSVHQIILETNITQILY